jgi:hypothetical protein
VGGGVKGNGGGGTEAHKAGTRTEEEGAHLRGTANGLYGGKSTHERSEPTAISFGPTSQVEWGVGPSNRFLQAR